MYVTEDDIRQIITPFELKNGKMGELSHGYDGGGRYTIRLADEGLHCIRNMEVHDPLQKVQNRFESIPPGSYVIPPGDMIMGVSIEEITVPDDIDGTIHTTSSYMRAGLTVGDGVLHSGWRGRLVIEIINGTRFPVRIYPGYGVVVIRFARCAPSRYNGKYQSQRAVVEVG
jgi:deoxycytidine triphosphate deaminase